MDLVSSLPEEVLCHILSFLSTKEAALTSVLSKRWLSLWTLVPNLYVDDSVFLHPEEEGKREREGMLQSFMDFVDRVLALQGDSPINRFSLKCKTGIDPDRVNLWIRNALRRGVSDLELVLDFPRCGSDDDDDDEEEYQLPWEMFESKTLVNVKLRSVFGVDWWRYHRGTFLPMLKSLIIDSGVLVLLSDELELVVSALPVVEELRLATMVWFDSDGIVSSASLRKLTLYAKGFEDFGGDPKCVSFDTPSLVYLDYSDYVAADYPVVDLTNLVEARLNLLVKEDQIQLIRAEPNGEDDVVIQRFRNVSKLMSGIRNVQKLSLTADTLEVLSLSCDSMPVFNSLKFLKINSHKERRWQAVPVLLRNCPHLETLVFEGLIHYVTDDCGDACGCISREDKGCSLVSCPVKKIEIHGFEITVPEMETIRHFLESLPCLKEMEIYAEDDDDDDPINLEVLREYKSTEMAMTYYSQLFKCDVRFIRPGSL